MSQNSSNQRPSAHTGVSPLGAAPCCASSYSIQGFGEVLSHTIAPDLFPRGSHECPTLRPSQETSSRRPSQDAAYVLAVIENPAVLDRLVERTGIPKEVFHIAASRWRELGYPDLESLHPSSLGNTPSVPPSMPQ